MWQLHGGTIYIYELQITKLGFYIDEMNQMVHEIILKIQPKVSYYLSIYHTCTTCILYNYIIITVSSPQLVEYKMEITCEIVVYQLLHVRRRAISKILQSDQRCSIFGLYYNTIDMLVYFENVKIILKNQSRLVSNLQTPTAPL